MGQHHGAARRRLRLLKPSVSIRFGMFLEDVDVFSSRFELQKSRRATLRAYRQIMKVGHCVSWFEGM